VSGSSLTLNAGKGFVYGTLVFDFTTGDYTYFTGSGIVAGASFTLTSMVSDLDGDTASAVQTITVVDGKPVARDDSATMFRGAGFLEGNVVSGLGTDAGIALGSQVTPFAGQASGVDTVVDNAKVTGIDFKGTTISLAAAGSGTVAGGNYTVAYTAGTGLGSLTWSNASTGEKLAFDSTGYYKYTPPAAAQPPALPMGFAATSQALDAAPSNWSGITLSALNGAGGNATVAYTAGSGAGVQGTTGSNSRVNTNEDLVITFDGTRHLGGATVQSITIDAAGGTIGGAAANTLTYTFYNAGNAVIGTYTSNASGVVAFPAAYTGVDHIAINADGGTSVRVQAVAYSSALEVVNLTSTPAAATGVTLAGMAYNSSTPNLTVTYNATSGVGVTGNSIVGAGGSDTLVDGLESLVVTFSQATYAGGVYNVGFSVNAGASNLGPDGSGASPSLTYKMYGVDGSFLGQFSSASEGYVDIPDSYFGIGQIIIEASGDATARIQGLSFSGVTNTGTTEVLPQTIGYTLTDSDGDTSSASLTLNLVSNDIYGTSGANTLNGTAANDRIVGGAGDDTLNGGAGQDRLDGGDGNDALDGGTGDDLLAGGAGNDTLTGGAGKDLLRGGDGDDSLNGGAGADTLVGGAGNDTLNGGGADLASDVFRWELNDAGLKGSPAVDTVTGFDVAARNAGGDVLDLRDLLVGDLAGNGNLDAYLHFQKSGSDTVIHVSSSGQFASGYSAAREVQTIVLQGVDLMGTLASDQLVIQDLLSKGKLLTD
jgi:Ca2+-binding RTX toxin-like protein